MAIPLGVLVQVVLMVLFGAIEVFEREQFHHNRLCILLLLRVKRLPDCRHVLRIDIIHPGTVLRALVVSLAVEAGGIDSGKVHLQKEIQ